MVEPKITPVNETARTNARKSTCLRNGRSLLTKHLKRIDISSTSDAVG